MTEAAYPRPRWSRRDLAFVFFRNPKKVLAVGLLVFGVAAAAAVLQQDVYRSDASLLLRVGRESISADPVVAVGETVHVTEMRAQQVRSDIEAMRSAALVEATVDELGAEAVLDALQADAPPGPVSQALVDLGLRPAPSGSARARATAAVFRRLGVAEVRDTNNVALTFEAPTPQFAQAFLKTFIEQLRIRHGALHRTSDSEDFFLTQMQTQRGALSAAQQELRDYRNSSGAMTLAARRDLAVRRSGELRTMLLAAETAVASNAERLAQYRSVFLAQPETLETSRTEGVPNHGAALMRSQLYQLQLRGQDIRSKYADSSAVLQDIEKQVKVGKELFEGEKPTHTEVTTGLNQARRQLLQFVVDAEAGLVGERARAKALRKQLLDSDQRMSELDSAYNESVLKIDQMSRQVDRRAQALRRYTEVFDQARLHRELDAKHLSSIRIVEPATLPVKPSRPDRLLILAVGLVLAVFLALLTALVSQAVSDVLSRPADVETRVGLPVLVSVPRSRGGRRVRA